MTDFTIRQIGNRFSLSLCWINVFVGAGAFWQVMNFPLPVPLQRGGHTQFLTNLGLGLTVIYFTITLLIHLFDLRKLVIVRDYLSGLAVSVEFVITTIYWGLRLFQEDLILKGEKIPLSLDLRIHLMPFISLLIDYQLFMNPWNVSYIEALLLSYSATVAYWFHLENLLQGKAGYPYPFLDVDTPERVAIFGVVGFVAFLSFSFFKKLHPLQGGTIKLNKTD